MRERESELDIVGGWMDYLLVAGANPFPPKWGRYFSIHIIFHPVSRVSTFS